MIGRIFLYLAVNAAVVLTISVILKVLGVQPYLSQYGLNIPALAIFCAVWGMTGSVISLFISRAVAKWTDRVELISPDTRDPALKQILDMVYNLARKAGLNKMPEVGIYDRPDPNAYATGPTRSMALVAVSTGLLSQMNRDEVEAVLAHEISHVANGDMVTMTLLQGIVNTFVLFLSRIIGFAVARERDEDSYSLVPWLVQIACQIVFMLIGSMIVAAFSRWREYRADAGAAKLAGKEKMIAALQQLERNYDSMNTGMLKPATAAMQISSKPSGFLALYASHPPLEDRIRRLQEGKF